MHVLKGRYYQIGAALFIAALLALMMAPIVQSQNGAKCFGKAVTIPGTSGPDVLNGTFDRDVIHGFAGEDTIRGEADFSGEPAGGSDFICGGSGDDPFMDGADKRDFIMGGDGDDVLDGDNFPSVFGDLLIGEEGNDTFTGGQGPDEIIGGPGNDTIDMGTGTTINQGADTIKAGGGDDTINEFGDGAQDDIRCGGGEDTVFADEGDNVADNCEEVINDAPGGI